MQKKYEKLNKKALGCMLVNELIIAIIFTIIAGVAYFFLKNVTLPVSVSLIWVATAIIWVICIVVPFVRYQRYRYCFTEEEIDMREGFFYIHRDIVPIERLHKIALISGPIDRIFGLAKVVVTTAGGDVVIRFLENDMAEKIVERLKNRINKYAIQSRNNGTTSLK